MDRTLRSALVCLAALLSATAGAQPKLWGNLTPGEYGVGFRSFWITDSGRTFTYKFADGKPYAPERSGRPILVNVWYPALHGGTPMPESGYLDFDPGKDSPIRRYARDLATANREVIARDVIGKPLAELDAAAKASLEDFLKFETKAVRRAAASTGRFPLAIYIQGSGSSLQDNATLCEYLTSHGYVVLGSAYQDETGRMIAGRDTVLADVRRLIEAARTMRQVDLSRVAVIGHSAGAQASMAYASKLGSIADAVVSLDTTQDYYFNDKQAFKSYLNDVDALNFRLPLLALANRAAIFDFVDTLDQSDRRYLIVDELGHDEYTSQGLARAVVKNAKNLDAVRERYTSVCEYARRFLDVNLKGRPSSDLSAIPSHFTLETAPRGTKGPLPWDEKAIPTQRQFRMLIESSPDKAIAALERFAKSDSDAPIYGSQSAFTIVDHLLEKRDVALAKRFMAVFNQGKKMIDVSTFVEWGDIFTRFNSKVEAARYFEKALMLDPGNKEAKAGLAKLKNP